MNATAPGTVTHEAVAGEHRLAAVTLSVNWSDDRATHEDQVRVEHFSVWREADLLPQEIGVKIPGMIAGDEADTALTPRRSIRALGLGQASLHQTGSLRPSVFDFQLRRKVS